VCEREGNSEYNWERMRFPLSSNERCNKTVWAETGRMSDFSVPLNKSEQCSHSKQMVKVKSRLREKERQTDRQSERDRQTGRRTIERQVEEEVEGK